MNSPHAELAPAPTSTLSSALTARRAYENAVTSDGVTAAAWATIALALRDSAAELGRMLTAGRIPAGYLVTAGTIQCLTDRAVDAAHRAQYAARMLEVCRRGPVIDMASIGGAS